MKMQNIEEKQEFVVNFPVFSKIFEILSCKLN